MINGIKCQICEEKEATIKCLNCSLNLLCKSCMEFIHNPNSKKDHKFEELKSVEGINFCKDHNSFSLNFFCKTCQKGICSNCTISPTHKQHLISPFSEINEDILKLLDNLNENYNKLIPEQSKCLKDILEIKDKNIKEIEGLCKQVIETFCKIEMIILQKKKRSTSIPADL